MLATNMHRDSLNIGTELQDIRPSVDTVTWAQYTLLEDLPVVSSPNNPVNFHAERNKAVIRAVPTLSRD